VKRVEITHEFSWLIVSCPTKVVVAEERELSIGKVWPGLGAVVRLREHLGRVVYVALIVDDEARVLTLSNRDFVSGIAEHMDYTFASFQDVLFASKDAILDGMSLDVIDILDRVENVLKGLKGYPEVPVEE